MRPILFFLAIAVLFPVAPSVMAETRYVSDNLTIYVRGGPATNFKIRAGIKSGASVEVLEENGEGWTRVKTNKGVEGWVLSRHLQREPVARERVAVAEKRAATAKSRYATAQAEIEQLRGNLSRLTSERDQLLETNSELNVQLDEIRAAAADAVAMKQRHDAMAAQLEQTELKRAELERDNRHLADNTQRDWFLYGGAVLLIGLILGLLVPHLPRRNRRDSWGSL